MIRRNALGAIEPRIRCYFIRKENGKWKILKNEGWYVTDVSLNENPWFEVEPFDSMVQAYAWLKEHVDELL